MGTPSITTFRQDGKTICCLYRHYDGHQHSHGLELARILDGILKGKHNGPGCITAQVIAAFKKESHNFYMVAPDSHYSMYDYTVDMNEGRLNQGPTTCTIKCTPDDNGISGLTPEEWISKFGLKQSEMVIPPGEDWAGGTGY